VKRKGAERCSGRRLERGGSLAKQAVVIADAAVCGMHPHGFTICEGSQVLSIYLSAGSFFFVRKAALDHCSPEPRSAEHPDVGTKAMLIHS